MYLFGDYIQQFPNMYSSETCSENDTFYKCCYKFTVLNSLSLMESELSGLDFNNLISDCSPVMVISPLRLKWF